MRLQLGIAILYIYIILIDLEIYPHIQNIPWQRSVPSNCPSSFRIHSLLVLVSTWNLLKGAFFGLFFNPLPHAVLADISVNLFLNCLTM